MNFEIQHPAVLENVFNEVRNLKSLLPDQDNTTIELIIRIQFMLKRITDKDISET